MNFLSYQLWLATTSNLATSSSSWQLNKTGKGAGGSSDDDDHDDDDDDDDDDE